MYNLHAIMNPATFLELSLNFCGFTTSTCVLDLVNTATLSLSLLVLLEQLLLAVLLAALVAVRLFVLGWYHINSLYMVVVVL